MTTAHKDLPALPKMMQAFIVSVSDGAGSYSLQFKFQTMDDMHRASDEWHKFCKAALARPEPASTPAPCGWLVGRGYDTCEDMFFRLEDAQRECDQFNATADEDDKRVPEPVYRSAPASTPVAVESVDTKEFRKLLADYDETFNHSEDYKSDPEDYSSEIILFNLIAHIDAHVAAQVAKAQRVPEGYALVPIEPTDAMLKAAMVCGKSSSKYEYYAAMLAAAPQGQQSAASGDEPPALDYNWPPREREQFLWGILPKNIQWGALLSAGLLDTILKNYDAAKADPAQEAGSDAALRSATELAKSIWRDNYKATAPNWEPLPDLMGVISQIDNMVAGMSRKTAPAQPAVDLVAKVKELQDFIDAAFVMHPNLDLDVDAARARAQLEGK